MKDSSNAAKKLLDLPYAPEAEQYLDELERSGQFRIGIEAEIDDADISERPPATTTPGAAAPAACRSRTGGPRAVSRCASAPASRPPTSRWRASTTRWCCARRTASIACARGLPRADPRCLHAAHHLQRRQRVDRRGLCCRASRAGWPRSTEPPTRSSHWRRSIRIEVDVGDAACRFRVSISAVQNPLR